MTRTTLLPSTTTQTASSSDQLGRDRLRPSMRLRRVAADRTDPQRRRHVGGTRPQRHHRRHLLAVARQRRRPSDPASGRTTRHARRPLTVERHQRSADQSVQAGRSAGAAPGSVAATSEVSQPSANRSSSAAPSALITYGPLIPARANVQMICAASSCLTVRVGGRQVLQLDARAAVAAADARSCRRRRASPVRAASAAAPAGCAPILAISGRGPAISLLTNSVAS